MNGNNIFPLADSYAKNNANKDSDIDIFVVADISGKKKIEITQQARRLLLKKNFMPVDILVCDSKDLIIGKIIRLHLNI